MGKQNKKCLGQIQTKYIMISHTRIVKIAKKVEKINKLDNVTTYKAARYICCHFTDTTTRTLTRDTQKSVWYF